MTQYPTEAATIIDSDTSTIETQVVNYIEGGAIVYVSGFVGTGPWTTTTSSSRLFVGGGSGGSGGGGSGGGGGISVDAARVRGKTMKIAVGVAVPVGLALLAALLLCCRKRKTKPQNTDTAHPNGPNMYAKPQMSAYGGQFGNPPGESTNLQEPIVGEDERAARLAQLEADKARVDTELARMRLEEEQRRVQAEIDGLRNQRH